MRNHFCEPGLNKPSISGDDRIYVRHTTTNFMAFSAKALLKNFQELLPSNRGEYVALLKE